MVSTNLFTIVLKVPSIYILWAAFSKLSPNSLVSLSRKLRWFSDSRTKSLLCLASTFAYLLPAHKIHKTKWITEQKSKSSSKRRKRKSKEKLYQKACLSLSHSAFKSSTGPHWEYRHWHWYWEQHWPTTFVPLWVSSLHETTARHGLWHIEVCVVLTVQYGCER